VEHLEAASDPRLEEIAIVGAACLAALDAARLPADALAAGERAGMRWREDGRRLAHGRYPR
jgi:hypothetical protein